LDKSAPKTAARIPHLRQIVGLRNILIHGYAVVKHDLIWRSVRDDLPQLRATVDALLKELGERE
ncbi:MAG TPA: HepT-like ribonuclease domain-containing protein, partial [Gemmatimonadales bacterium]|nr:HepT-like ribonuclease domain-containing protein [Gemmatimonadales bacterium]